MDKLAMPISLQGMLLDWERTEVPGENLGSTGRHA